MRIALALFLFALNVAAQSGLRSPAFVGSLNKGASGPTFPPDANMHWTLDEASGNSRSENINGNDFSETVTAVASTTGKKGDAANWAPGTGYLNLGLGFADLGSAFSVAFWINCDNLPVGSNAKILDGNGMQDPVIEITPAGNVITTNSLDGNANSVALGSLDSWHLVVFTYDGTGCDKDYGLSVDGGTFDHFILSAIPDGSALRLGQIGTLDAAVDEMTVWLRAITQQEATDLWNGGTGIFYVP